MPWPKRTPRSAETRAKLSVAMRGNTHLLGHRHTEETKARIGAASLGHTLSDEARAKVSAAKTTERHHRWNGGTKLTDDGYRRIRVAKGRYVLEHRHVMELHLGRPLLRTEVVHHINGDRLDNSIKNLQLFRSHAEHLKHHNNQ